MEESLFMGKPMSYWYAISKRIDAGPDSYTVNALLMENSLLHSKVGIYEDRIRALMDAFNMMKDSKPKTDFL